MTRANGILVAVAIVLGSAFGISRVQPGLANSVRAVKQRDDVFLLPPDDELRAMTLGYKSAAADLLWAKLVVEHGLHHQEKRPFPEIYRYLDGILALEPDYALLYTFVDTMVCYGPGGPKGPEEAHATKRYFERGVAARPYDAELWLHYGQFMAFLAPTFLADKAEIEKWRLEGSFAIARAVELGSDPNRSLAATSILSKSNEREATIRHLQRLYALSDDQDFRQQMLLRLQKLEGPLDAERVVGIVENEWHMRYPFLSRSAALLVGPSRSTAGCAGPASYDKKRCPRDWETAVSAH